MSFHHLMTGVNSHVVGYVQAGDPGAVGTGIAWIDTSGGAGAWVFKIRNALNNGWEIEDKYTQAEVDALIDAIDPSEVVPHFNKGTGPFTVHCVGGYVECGDAGAAEVARIHPRDMIMAMNGGEASPTYSFNIKFTVGSYVTADPDPTVPYIEVDADDETVGVTVYVTDGTTVRETDCFVVCSGTPSGP